MKPAVLRLALAALFAIGTFTTIAHADDPKVRAKEAYARGLAAHDAHDFKASARAFAEADTILPSPAALAAALDAAVLADDPVLGAELIERGNRPGATPELTKSLADARAKLGGRAGKLRLVCPAGATCSALVDEKSMTKELWVSAGTHTVTTRVDTTMKEQRIEVGAGETVVLSPERPAPVAQPVPPPPPPGVVETTHEPPPKKKSVRRLSPVFVYAGAGLALATAGGAVASGILTKNRHDAFTDKGCSRANNPGCEETSDEGIMLLILTNVLIGTAVASAVATTAVGLFFVDWHPTASATSNGATFGLSHRF